MNAAAYKLRPDHNGQSPDYLPNMNRSVGVSFVLHLLIVVLGTVGLPFLMKEPDIREMAITVEMVDLADVSQTTIVDKPQESKEEKPEPTPPAPPKPVYKTESEPPPAPDLLTPEPPEKQEDIPEPPKEEKMAELEKPKPKPPTPPKPPKNRPKPKPPEPKQEKPKEVKEKPKEEPEPDISSLLKSVLNEEQTPTPQTDQKPEENSEPSQTSQIAELAAKLSRSEEDDLNAGVSPCWNVNAGGKDAHTLIVSLRVFVNPDMRVGKVEILDQLRYAADSHFRTAAESARRALLNPKCSTLRLPPEKYEQWKVFRYDFDPSNML